MIDFNNVKFINDMLIPNNRIYVPEPSSSSEENRELAIAMTANLAQLGYVLDIISVDHLAHMSQDDLSRFYNDIITRIKDIKGLSAFYKTELFYPNFPEEVLEKDNSELMLNSLIYYTGYFYFGEDLRNDMKKAGLVQEKKERLPLVEKFPKEKTILMYTGIDEFHKLMDDRIHSMGMSEDQEKSLIEYAKHYPEKFKEMATDEAKPYASRENLVKVAGMLYDPKKKETIGTISKLLKDSPDVMRFAAYLSNKKLDIRHQNAIDLSGRLVFKLDSSEKKTIRTLLANCKHLYQDIWTRPSEETWKHFARHINWKENYPEKVHDAFDKLYRRDKTDEKGTPIQSPERQFELAWKERDMDRLERLADAFPGLYMSHVMQYAKNSLSASETFDVIGIEDSEIIRNAMERYFDRVCDIAGKVAGRVEPIKALEIYNLVDERFHKEEARVFTKKDGTTQVRLNEDKGTLSEDETKQLKAKIYEGVIKGLRNTKKLGNVYIDKALEGFMVPKRDIRNASDGAVLAKYSKIAGGEGKNLVALGASWTGEHVDIDVSVAAYDKDYNAKGALYYSNIKTPWGCHSGDYVTAPDGASEIAIVDKEELKEHGIKYLSLSVKGFNVPFNKSEDGVTVILMEKEGSLHDAVKMDSHKAQLRKDGSVTFLGEVVEPTQIEYPITLTADATCEVAYIYDVEQDVFHWVDKANGIGLGRNIADPEFGFKSTQEIYAIEHNTIPTMDQLIRAYVDAGCGRIVNDMEMADTIFTSKTMDREENGVMEHTKVYIATDLNTFSKEFCAKQSPIDDDNLTKEHEMIKVEEEKQNGSVQEEKRLTPLQRILNEAKKEYGNEPRRTSIKKDRGDDER